MDDWNPMRTAYEDKKFNSFKEGVGRDLSGSNPLHKGAQLYVKNVPLACGKEGLFNLFAEHGRVLHCTFKASTKKDAEGVYGFGFVTMERMEDAATAISKLNNRKLGSSIMKVSPALTEEEKQRRKEESDMIKSITGNKAGFHDDDSRSWSSLSSSVREPRRYETSNMTSGSGLDISRSDWHSLSASSDSASARVVPKLAISVGRGISRHVMERGETINLPHEGFIESLGRGRGASAGPRGLGQPLLGHGYYSQRTAPGGLNSTLMPRGINQTGMPRGRGYMMNQGPPPGRSFPGPRSFLGGGGGGLVGSNIRPPGTKFCIVQPPPSVEAKAAKLCVNCYKDGCVSVCSRCKMYYCSVDCQKKDWPRHKDICMSIREMLNGESAPSDPFPQYSSGYGSSVQTSYDTDIEGVRSRVNKNQNRKKEKIYDSDSGHRDQEARRKPRDQNQRGDDSKGKFKSENSYSMQNRRNAPEEYFSENNQNGSRGPNEDRFVKSSGSPRKSPNKKTSKPFKGEGGNQQQKSKFEGKNLKGGMSKDSKKSNARGADAMGGKKREKHQGGSSADTDSAEDGGMKQRADAGLPAVDIALPEKASGRCYLTYYENADKFWVSLDEYLEVFSDTMELMRQELSKLDLRTAVKPKVGEVYGVLLEDGWTRTRVVSVQGQEVMGFFIDYGNQAPVKMADLKPLSGEIMKLPAQAICCRIGNVKPKGSEYWSEAASAAVSDWLGAPMSKMMQYEVISKKGSVHAMKFSSNNEAISEMLLSKGFAERATEELGKKKQQVPQQPVRVMANQMESRMSAYSEGDKLTVEFIDYTSLEEFSVQDVAQQKTLAEITKLLSTQSMDSGEPYRPKVGELVVAKFTADNAWYRSQVLEVEGDQFAVVFVDYGNYEVQVAENIRPMTNEKLMKMPFQALLCGLADVHVPKDVDADTVKMEFHNLLLAFIDNGRLSMVVKGTSKDLLQIDFESDSGLPMSHLLNKKLADKSSSGQCQSPARPSSVKSPGARSPTTPPQTGKGSSPGPEPSKAASRGIIEETLPERSEETVSVLVSSVTDCSNFFVRKSSKHEKFINMMKELDQSVKSSPSSVSATVGSLVAVQFSMDGLWYRGRVETITGDICQVRFIDYGNSETTTTASLKQLVASLHTLPAQAIRCHLAERPESFSSEAHKEFKMMEDSLVDVKVLGKDSKGYSVQLFIDGADIGALLSGSQENTENRPTGKRKIPHLAVDKTAPVKIECADLISPLRFYVQVSDHMTAIMEIMCKINNQLQKNPRPLGRVSAGDFAASRFSQDNDEVWYRVRVDKVDGDRCTIFFVDYGNMEETSVSGLMELSEDDFSVPACILKCRLNGCKKTTPELDKMFSTRAQGQIVSIQVISQEEDECVVDILDCAGKSITDMFTGSVPTSSTARPEYLSSVKPAPATKCPPAQRDIEVQSLPSSGESVPVRVTHIDAYWRLYVSHNDSKLTGQFVDVFTTMQSDAESWSVLQDPAEGAICAAQYSRDGSWCRAQVVTICNSTTCVVCFVDFGNREETPLANLRHIDPALTKLPAQAIPCCLLGYESRLDKAGTEKTKESSSSDAARWEKFKAELLEQQVTVSVVKRVQDTWVVKMENEHGECITGKFPPPVETAAPTPILSDLIIETPTDKEFDALIVHPLSLEEFYCHRDQNLVEYDHLSKLLKEDASKVPQDSHVEPMVNGVYISEFQGSWYRCVVQEVKGSQVCVQYIDFGNCEVKPASELRPLAAERLSVPVKLLKCKLYGVTTVLSEQTSSQISEYLHMLQQRMLHLVIEGEEGDTLLVSLIVTDGTQTFSVAEDLVSSELAKLTETPKERSGSIKSDSGQTPSPTPVQEQKAASSDEEEGDDELEIQRKIQELQKQLEMSQKKKMKVKPS